jgi:hypothetical protein
MSKLSSKLCWQGHGRITAASLKPSGQSGIQSKFQADELSAGLNGDRVVPCIVDEGVHFRQLPASLQKLFVAKVTEQSLASKEGKARLQKLIEDLSHIAATKQEPTDGSPEQGRGDRRLSGEP